MNGVAEKINGDSMDAVRTLLLASGLSPGFWGEEFQCYAYARNRLPHSTDKKTTPYEKWYGRKPNISHFRIFGNLCSYHLPKIYRNKLEPVARKGIFVGYAMNTKGYRVSDLEKRKVTKIKHVKFDESVIGVNGKKRSFSDRSLSDNLGVVERRWRTVS
ncbi:Retrovirus-related Pol polyprotein from transposon TNT 1-94 [Araneus ventricosus]|uniref:Retrovirus-related Pol polyprotein from transposon TNT 1-94 n=1 Tax=Araneus ventricosus TaxID=182803 RepID=A0A4Y2WNN6_ARAVE|nr:Retrovirus-related Pol polyprotein from transposon TNT 1-94 [Araneus ventricosus]